MAYYLMNKIIIIFAKKFVAFLYFKIVSFNYSYWTFFFFPSHITYKCSSLCLQYSFLEDKHIQKG